jgi:hypothetical protein
MNNAPDNPSERYQAFVTTDLVNGERIPINGERIVIVLGEDEEGRPLELSFSLIKAKGKEGRLAVYSIPEHVPADTFKKAFPIPFVEPCPPVNVFRVSVQWRSSPLRDDRPSQSE